MGLAHFHRNVGVSGVLRGVFVAAAMLALGVYALVRDGEVAPLAVFVAAMIVPMCLRRTLVAHLEISGVVIKYTGYALVATAVTSAGWSDRVLGGDNEHIFGAVLLGVVGLYCSAWFAVCSDPTVITERARRRAAE